MQDVHQGDTYMYLLDHLTKTSELLVHSLLAIPCGKRQVASVDKSFGAITSSCSFPFPFFKGSAS
jgi:hypothetical protein